MRDAPFDAIPGGRGASGMWGMHDTPQHRRSETMEVTLRMKQKQVAAGSEPVALLYTDNVSDNVLMIAINSYRIHLEGEKGEPPKTEWYHGVLGDPGYALLTMTVNASTGIMVAPENSYRWDFRLNSFCKALPRLNSATKSSGMTASMAS